MQAAVDAAGLGRLAVAFLWHEQKNATQTSIPAVARNPFSVKAGGGWAVYGSYASAAAAWAARLLDPNGPYAGTTTLVDLIRVYAPASDGNDEARYVEVVCAEVDRLPRVDAPAAAWSPVVYDVQRDYARFGLSAADAAALAQFCFWNRDGAQPLAIFAHIQDGNTPGSLDWWLRGVVNGRRVQASSTVTIQRDGSILRVIPEQHGPWTNGEVNRPTDESAAFRQAMGGRNLNCGTLSIEFEGAAGQVLTPAQLRSGVWQVRDWRRRYASVRWLLPHSSVDSVNRGRCPGDGVMAQLRAGLENGSADPPAEPQAPRPGWAVPWPVIQAVFPDANSGQPLTEHWRTEYANKGKYPDTRIVRVGGEVYMVAGGEVWRWTAGGIVRAGGA